MNKDNNSSVKKLKEKMVNNEYIKNEYMKNTHIDTNLNINKYTLNDLITIDLQSDKQKNKFNLKEKRNNYNRIQKVNVEINNNSVSTFCYTKVFYDDFSVKKQENIIKKLLNKIKQSKNNFIKLMSGFLKDLKNAKKIFIKDLYPEIGNFMSNPNADKEIKEELTKYLEKVSLIYELIINKKIKENNHSQNLVMVNQKIKYLNDLNKKQETLLTLIGNPQGEKSEQTNDMKNQLNKIMKEEKEAFINLLKELQEKIILDLKAEIEKDVKIEKKVNSLSL